MPVRPADQPLDSFDAFARTDGRRLLRVLVAQLGVEAGSDAHAEAMQWAWRHRDRLLTMANPAGYLFRVAQTSAARQRARAGVEVFPGALPEMPGTELDHDLFASLGSLTDAQRVCVLMVHAHRWTYQEVAQVLGIEVTAVNNHVHRGLRRLRNDLGEAP